MVIYNCLVGLIVTHVHTLGISLYFICDSSIFWRDAILYIEFVLLRAKLNILGAIKIENLLLLIFLC